MKWGERLHPGAMVEVWESKSLGFIIERDHEHLYLWKVFHENSIHVVHSSKLRLLLT